MTAILDTFEAHGIQFQVEMQTCRLNALAMIRPSFPEDLNKPADRRLAYDASLAWIKTNYPDFVDTYGVTGVGYEITLRVSQLKAEHLLKVGHPVVYEATEGRRDVCFDEQTGKFVEIFPESETYAGQRIFEQFKTRDGIWVMIPSAHE